MAGMDTFHEIERIIAGRAPTPGDPLACLGSCRSVIVYGAGNVGRDVTRLLRAHGRSPIGFLDANARPGQLVEGLPVHRLAGDLPAGWDPASTAVVIAIFNFAVDIVGIEEALGAAGFGKVVNFLELHRHFAAELGDRYWLTDLGYYDGKAAQIARALDLLADDRSRSVMRSLLRLRVTGDYGCSTPLDVGPQYFGPAAPPLRQPVRLVDGGAFDGDTVRSLFQTTREVEAVACFEPDPGNHQKLVACCEPFKRESKARISLLPLGLWSTATQLRFNSDGGTGSGISDDGAQVIQCARLDDALADFRPTLVKMDIEGAEVEALHGAERTIRESRPDLAICVYHRPDHLWTIPLIVEEWGLRYRLTLRVHCHAGFEVVLYAQAV